MIHKRATIQFYKELNDFLPEFKRNSEITVTFKGRQSIKHIIEALGVPHPEVDRILVNKNLEVSTYILQDEDRVEVYPVYDYGNIFKRNNFQPRFILDNHLGKLATYLRMLGFDTLYENDFQDDQIVSKIKRDERILLTRDQRLLMRREITLGYFVRRDQPKKQLIEIIDKFNLIELISTLKRCLKCNHMLIPIEKTSIIHRLEPLTKLYYEVFHKCPHCDQLYWKGSHYEHMLDLILEVKLAVQSN